MIDKHAMETIPTNRKLKISDKSVLKIDSSSDKLKIIFDWSNNISSIGLLSYVLDVQFFKKFTASLDASNLFSVS
ncbi:hypothetical protein BpHYR1_000819 [Brachionus plicatilis]|uniref:Uncharacterized protein n=1 Tax=Brachionus plicatilis TaxID=10195 RepID=A0A3M7RIB8_BRAPC|nr:hypothetical protein BpHYR1_000819 [Brachionus plicatilis]